MDPTSSLYPSRELTKNNSNIRKVIEANTTKEKKRNCYMTTELSLIDRTLSNWVYEFDKWAPTVVKVSYKVSFYSHGTNVSLMFLTSAHKPKM